MRMAQVNWDIDWRGQPSAERSDGSTQVVNNAFPRWVGSPRVVLNSGQLAQWRAIRWQAQGRLGIYRVFMVDPHVFNRRAHASRRHEIALENPSNRRNRKVATEEVGQVWFLQEVMTFVTMWVVSCLGGRCQRRNQRENPSTRISLIVAGAQISFWSRA